MTILNKGISHRNLTPSYLMMSIAATSITMVSVNAYANQTLTSLSVVQPSNQTTQLRLDFDAPPVIPEAYQLENPDRLVLDFNQVSNDLPSRYNEINQGVVTDITTLNNEETIRLIVGLTSLKNKEFTTLAEGNSLLVNIANTDANNNANAQTSTNISLSPLSEQQSVQNVSPAQTNNVESPQDSRIAYSIDTAERPAYVESTLSSASTPGFIQQNINATNQPKAQENQDQKSQSSTDKTMVVRVNPLLNPASATYVSQQYNYNGVTNVSYTGGSEGGGSINIGIANESIPVDIQRQGNKIVVRVTGATVPPNLVRQHNVSGGLVSSVNARNNGKNGIITIAMGSDFEYQAFQSGTQVNITVKPPKLLREPTLEEKKYTGETLSVDFQNVAIRNVLHLLSQFTELNIVATDSVTGDITLNLINVPWDQALDIILKSKNLAMRTNGNVIYVAPALELAEQEHKELEQQQKVKDFLPLRTEYIRLSYAKGEDVLNLIAAGRNSDSNIDNERGTLLSERGTVTVDARTNTLIVQDTSDSIENVRALISKIDIPVRQVMIEARIVSATDNFSKELGVKWGILSNGVANNRDLLVGGSDQTLADLKDFTIETTTINGQQVSYPTYTINRPENLNVDLGVANPAGRIAFGLLSMSDLMIDLELSAMQADGRGEVISSPRILTMDKQTAKVASGTQIPYQEASASGATSTSFVEAALSLEATPNITPDGKIALELNIQNATPTSLAVNGAVAISKDSLTTNVIVEDGQTIVLGGIFRNQTSNGVEKVPFLGDLPYVGRLFRNDKRSNEKQELLIFVTPKLLTDGVTRLN